MIDAGIQLFDDLMRFKPEGMTANAWAVNAGVSRTIWSDLRRHGNPSRRTLEKLLATAGSSLAEFEALRIGREAPVAFEGSPNVTDTRSSSWGAAPVPPIPLLETRPAGARGEPGSGIDLMALRQASIIGYAPRPASLAADRAAYALVILGEAMWPRFRPGRTLLVSPGAPILVGDDVAVQLRPGPDGEVKLLIRELVRRSSSFVEVRQFNPDLTFRIDAAEIAVLHRVVGEAI